MEEWAGARGQALGHHAVDLTASHNLAVTPRNYEVWLRYLSSTTPDLKAALNAMLDTGRRLTSADIELLYDQYLSPQKPSTRILDAGVRIGQEVADALDALRKAGGAMRRYDSTLSLASTALNTSALTAEGLKQVVGLLAVATTSVVNENRDLEHKLERSSSEMEALSGSIKKARQDSLIDGLTGVGNRKMFDESLSQAAKDASATGNSLCLVICDIDHFKAFNDQWGHQAGDNVIRLVAVALQHYALPHHSVARFGGEEFAIVMPGTTLAAAGEVAAAARQAIASRRLVRRSTQTTMGSVTASFGCAAYSGSESPADLIARADACLYASKHQGRNRVTLQTSH